MCLGPTINTRLSDVKPAIIMRMSDVGPNVSQARGSIHSLGRIGERPISEIRKVTINIRHLLVYTLALYQSIFICCTNSAGLSIHDQSRPYKQSLQSRASTVSVMADEASQTQAPEAAKSQVTAALETGVEAVTHCQKHSDDHEHHVHNDPTQVQDNAQPHKCGELPDNDPSHHPGHPELEYGHFCKGGHNHGSDSGKYEGTSSI